MNHHVTGDILRYYVLGGLLLLVAYPWPSRGLLSSGVVLAVLVPYGVDVATWFFGDAAPMPDWKQVTEASRSPEVSAFFRAEHQLALWRYQWSLLMSDAAPVAGTFLFGMWMARHQYIQQAEHHRARLKTLAWWGLGLGLPAQVLLMASVPLVYLGHLALTLCYICGLTLRCLHPAWLRRLSVLAPAGRMTLTNYILQSILGALVFYGFGLGLYGRVGSFVALLLTLGLCVFQLLSSAWWLRQPLEWLCSRM